MKLLVEKEDKGFCILRNIDKEDAKKIVEDELVLAITDDDVDDENIKRLHFHLQMITRFYEKYDSNKIRVYKKKSLKYYAIPVAFINVEPKYIIIYINDKYIVTNPKITYEQLDKILKNQYGEEIEDVKVYYFMNPDEIKTEQDIICFDEWFKFETTTSKED